MPLVVIGACSLAAGALGLRVLLPRLGYDDPMFRSFRMRFVVGMWTLIACGVLLLAGGIVRIALTAPGG